jgi:hypothetical protein
MGWKSGSKLSGLLSHFKEGNTGHCGGVDPLRKEEKKKKTEAENTAEAGNVETPAPTARKKGLPTTDYATESGSIAQPAGREITET